MIKHHEFWHPRVFELPFYLYLAGLCLRYRLRPTDLAKANTALNHGEIGIGSKYHTQMQFNQGQFLPTERIHCVQASAHIEANLQKAIAFANQHGYPLIFKPDIGLVGKGILKLGDEQALRDRIGELQGYYLMQKFTDYECEYGVFYTHLAGQSRISGINQKHFPTVVGDGETTIAELAQKHPRYTEHWNTFLQYLDCSRIPASGEELRLSFIGSHTMGCMFTDDSHLCTPELEDAIFSMLDPQSGFNFGRLDVKAPSEEALRRGEFVVIEVNGISSLPTHMFDPAYSFSRCYKIFCEHGRYLAKIANENKHKTMHLLPFIEVLRRVKMNQGRLDVIHKKLKSKAGEA